VQADDPVVGPVPRAPQQPRRLGAVDQLARGVVPQEQRVGHLADGRPTLRGAAAHREEELVLGGSETLGLRLLLAPVQEPPELGAEPQQVFVVAVGDRGA
jgi:hypothetical protein